MAPSNNSSGYLDLVRFWKLSRISPGWEMTQEDQGLYAETVNGKLSLNISLLQPTGLAAS